MKFGAYAEVRWTHGTAGNSNNAVQNVVMHRPFDPRLTAGNLIVINALKDDFSNDLPS